VAHLTTLPLIDEWKPSNPAVTPIFFVVLAATSVLLLIKRPRMSAVRWLLLLGLLALALFQMRHQAVLAILAAMLLPAAFAPRDAGLQRTGIRLAAAAGAAIVLVRLFLPMTLPENEANPWALIAAVPPQLRSEPVLNGYAMGGPLILSGIRPYIDGRSDMYGDALVADYKQITEGDAVALNNAVERWDIQWAILPRRYVKLVSLLDRSSDWKRIAEDRAGLIYVRNRAVFAR
jgi:hypothetical protein